MKRLFACTVALGLFAAVPAVAAPGGDHQGNKHDTATQGTNSHSASGGTHQNAPGGAMTGGSHGGGGGNSHGPTTTQTFSAGVATGGTHTRTGGGNSHGTMSGSSLSAGVATGGTHTKTRGVSPQGAMSGNSSSAGTSFSTNSGRNSIRRNNSAPTNTVLGNTAGMSDRPVPYAYYTGIAADAAMA